MTSPSTTVSRQEERWNAARALGQAAAVSQLYPAAHPVAQRAIEEARLQLERVLADGRPLVLGSGRTGWCIDGEPLPAGCSIPDALGGAFARHGFAAMALWPGVDSAELAAACELAGTSERLDVAACRRFLAERGARRVTLGQDRSDEAPAPEAPRPATAHPFGDFLKRLVERSVRDPREQARLYEEAVGVVREGMREMLEGQIAAAQAQLESQARGLLDQCQRTQRVFAAVADGRVTIDEEGRVLAMNSAAEQIAGKPLREVAGKPAAQTLSGEERMLAIADPRDPKEPVKLHGAEEACEAFRSSVALVCDPEGRVVGTYGVLPHAAKAEETARMQEDFVSRVTHELKAPLTAIAAAVDMIKEHAESLPGEDQTLLEMSQRNVDRLRRLIDDLLDFASLESGKVRVRPEPCEALGLVEEAAGSMRPWAESRGIRVSSVPTASPLAPVRADGPRVVQILTNLISNAIKATPAGGSIDCGVAAEGRFARFWVRDTGCGIPRQEQRRIFEKFVQLPVEGAKREGIGLGLAIVVDLVARHGGTMSLQSEPGKGALFSFTIPFAA